MNPILSRRLAPDRLTRRLASGVLGCLLLGLPAMALAQEHAATPASAPVAARKPASAASSAKEIGNQVREALETSIDTKKRLVLNINEKPKKPAMITELAEPVHLPPGGLASPMASRQYIRARVAAMTGHTEPPVVEAQTGEVDWSYEGANGPQTWGQLKPDFNLCATGKRQSPINIEESATLQGPAEPIMFSYAASGASVFNNGHTIQVDVVGDNRITVRGSEFKLLQFHFHHPSEERVNFQGFAMVAHLVHRNAEGQLAVVAVLLEPGAANPVIDKVWTYMPLDTGDRVRMPANALELAQLLPKDQRYYQFMGSLTTPPCSEGVLWMVLKQPVTVSREQLRLFAQLFPNNARPVQAVNGRAVRNAQ
jgi:carbonic anhydrase